MCVCLCVSFHMYAGLQHVEFLHVVESDYIYRLIVGPIFMHKVFYFKLHMVIQKLVKESIRV